MFRVKRVFGGFKIYIKVKHITATEQGQEEKNKNYDYEMFIVCVK